MLNIKTIRHTACLVLCMLAATLPVAAGKIFEGEDVKLTGKLKTRQSHRGFSGSGYLEGFYKNAKDHAVVIIHSEQAGPAELTLRYSAGNGDAPTVIGINRNYTKYLLEATSSWSAWRHEVLPVGLLQGLRPQRSCHLLIESTHIALSLNR